MAGFCNGQMGHFGKHADKRPEAMLLPKSKGFILCTVADLGHLRLSLSGSVLHLAALVLNLKYS